MNRAGHATYLGHRELGLTEFWINEERAMNDTPHREMPRYQCHKQVWALKIAKLVENFSKGETTMTPADDGYAPFVLPREYVAKHQPQEGGYFVQYDDGYASFSPAKAFEDGYTRI